MWWLKSTFTAIAALLFLSGCKTSADAPPELLRKLARSYLVGVTYDQALIAARQENPRALRGALRRLEALDATDVAIGLRLASAEERVRNAVGLQMQAYQLKDTTAARRYQLEAQAAHEYRRALRWTPQFPSKDPSLLNALGYFLADHGTTPKDFETALHLTSNAIAILNKQIQNSKKNGSAENTVRRLEMQLSVTRDSQAWALYRLKRFDEAELVQRRALELAKTTKLDNGIVAELWMHHAAILQATGNTIAAEAALQESKRLEGKEN